MSAKQSKKIKGWKVLLSCILAIGIATSPLGSLYALESSYAEGSSDTEESSCAEESSDIVESTTQELLQTQGGGQALQALQCR